MNFEKNKGKCLFAAVLVLSLAVSMFALPAANAHTPPWTISTYSYVSIAPNPVGVGQTAYVNFWIDKVPPTAEGGWGYKWHNMTVTVTKPDGISETLGPFNSDAVGGAWASYVPSQVGTYKFVGHFPTQTVVNENPYPFTVGFVPIGLDFVNDTYTASTSKEVTLTVQQQQVQSAYPAAQLPTGYWQRPINSMNRDWASIGGNWLGLAATSFGATGTYDGNGANFNPYTTAPSSAHVVWTKAEAFGGQIGGEFGSSETSLYATGTAYEDKFGAVILYGNLYYTQYPGAGNNIGPLTAVDLRTGKTLWAEQVALPLRVGMIYNFISGDQYGAHAYLFTAPATIGFIMTPANFAPKWSMYDAMTGQWVLDIANQSAGTLVEGPSGELLSYSVAGGMLTMWNSSLCIAVGSQKNNIYLTYSSAEIWRPPQGATIDWNAGNQWSKPLATSISGVPIVPALGISKISGEVVLMTALPGGIFVVPGGAQIGYRIDAGYSAKTGQLLWGPLNRTLTPWTTVAIGATDSGVYTEYTQQTLSWTGYSLTTGQKLWGPTASKNSSWGYYDFGADSVIGYGNLYSFGLGGEVYAYDLQTGAIKWYWNAGNPGVDSPFGTWPLGTWQTHELLADGKLYVRAGHDYTPPVFKGAQLYCVNATTGEKIWSSLSFDIVSSPAVADGYMLWFNGYDNQIYCYNAGPSATTVSAPATAVPQGSPVLIQGTVTDQSPGQTSLGIPAAGTPAISDARMSAWMEYLYQQQPKPANATGVPVHLTAIDPNGNYQDIGTATSDAAGMYKTMWTPPVPGAYTIIATFEGSNSYYASSAETALAVAPASSAAVVTPTPAPTQTPAPTSAPTQTPTSPSPSVAPQPTSGIPASTYIAIAAAVVIIAVLAAALVLRRRK